MESTNWNPFFGNFVCFCFVIIQSGHVTYKSNFVETLAFFAILLKPHFKNIGLNPESLTITNQVVQNRLGCHGFSVGSVL